MVLSLKIPWRNDCQNAVQKKKNRKRGEHQTEVTRKTHRGQKNTPTKRSKKTSRKKKNGPFFVSSPTTACRARPDPRRYGSLSRALPAPISPPPALQLSSLGQPTPTKRWTEMSCRALHLLQWRSVRQDGKLNGCGLQETLQFRGYSKDGVLCGGGRGMLSSHVHCACDMRCAFEDDKYVK